MSVATMLVIGAVRCFASPSVTCAESGDRISRPQCRAKSLSAFERAGSHLMGIFRGVPKGGWPYNELADRSRNRRCLLYRRAAAQHGDKADDDGGVSHGCVLPLRR